MKLMIRSMSVLAMSAISCALWAAPTYLFTHNRTEYESNAFIDGTIPSVHPTKANADSKVYWNMVKLACHGHTINNECSALIKIATDTPAPIDIGYVSLNLLTGEITPKQLSANGFTITINGPGETTLTKD